MSHVPLVLIVDDERWGREALRALVESLDMRTVEAAGPHEALEMASSLVPDVILLDVMMPDMDGFEVCRRLRADPRVAEVPVLLVTALDDHDSRVKGLEAGADEFISKPFNRAELRARLRTIGRLNRYRRLVDERSRLAAAYEKTLEAWVSALDLRDNETEGHTQRVTTMTLAMAREVGFEEENLEHVRRGALLHDIGKIGVPDAILHKPGPLSDEEWVVMRKHPTFAYELLRHVDFLLPALDIPYCHHENWDGKGYPRGLAGNDIPYAARLFAVVDAYDAMTSDRPYKRAWPQERALATLQEAAGKRFDPDVVTAFTRYLARRRAA